jgi:hypothetical protein
MNNDEKMLNNLGENNKVINITGTNNRYCIKKLLKQHKQNKKRVVCNKWNISEDTMTYKEQFTILQNICNNKYISYDNISKILLQELEKKIYSYKQQDILKNTFNEEKFITIQNIIDKIIETKLKCFYCDCEMFLLYELVREMKQWSVDRIDNDNGHNIDNYVLACLDCNLKRRNRTSDKFLFTKKLNIVRDKY